MALSGLVSWLSGLCSPVSQGCLERDEIWPVEHMEVLLWVMESLIFAMYMSSS